MKCHRMFILLLLINVEVFAQSFPPPVWTNFETIGIILHLEWELPEREFSSFNIYKNGALYRNTTETYLYDTLSFYSWNYYHLTALYINPSGESDPNSCALLHVYEGFIYIPHSFTFENECELLASFAVTGDDYWEFTDQDSHSGRHCAVFRSESVQYSSMIESPPLYTYDTIDQVILGFWYKIPIIHGSSDELFVTYRNGSVWDTLGPLSNTPDWTYMEVVFPYDTYPIKFTAISYQGGGVFLDDISLNGLVVSIDENKVDQQVTLLQSYPNPCSDVVTIPMIIKKSGHYELTIYTQCAQVQLNMPLGYLTPGEQTVKIDVTSLPRGIYLYRLYGTDANIALKMIVK